MPPTLRVSNDKHHSSVYTPIHPRSPTNWNSWTSEQQGGVLAASILLFVFFFALGMWFFHRRRKIQKMQRRRQRSSSGHGSRRRRSGTGDGRERSGSEPRRSKSVSGSGQRTRQSEGDAKFRAPGGVDGVDDRRKASRKPRHKHKGKTRKGRVKRRVKDNLNNGELWKRVLRFGLRVTKSTLENKRKAARRKHSRQKGKQRAHKDPKEETPLAPISESMIASVGDARSPEEQTPTSDEAGNEHENSRQEAGREAGPSTSRELVRLVKHKTDEREHDEESTLD